MLSLMGKSGVVFGAGSIGPGWGAGKAVAILFAQHDANVVCTDFKIEGLTETVRQIRSGFGRGEAVAYAGDASSAIEIRRIFERCVETYGSMDFVINNIGGSIAKSIGNSDDVFDTQLAKNLEAARISCEQAALMLGQGGVTINMVSIASEVIALKDVVGGLRKIGTGVGELSQYFSAKLAENGVRCSTVMPVFSNTPLTGIEILDPRDGRTVEARVFRRQTDLAHAALFLVSDEARFVTGVSISVEFGPLEFGATS